MYINKIPDDAVLIKNSVDYIDRKGNVYGIENRNNNKNKGKPFIKTQRKIHGYKYCGINYKDGRHVSKRVHRLVAEAFIQNPNNYPIVMHIDNNKSNNNVDNLKWGTISENTKQAVDDGLLVNNKGFEDSQSTPCTCYDSLTNNLVDHYGSIKEASKDTGISVCGVLFHMKNPGVQIRKNLYFTAYKSGPLQHPIIVQYDFKTDKEIGRFITIGKASKCTGVSDSTISNQISLNQKPRWSKDGCYFKKIII